MHCAVYQARSDARAVVHAHAPHATILANAGLPFLPISTEAAFFDDIPRVPFIMPGTSALADAVREAVRKSWAVLLVNHGLLVAGRSLRRAADMVEIVERSAEVILGCAEATEKRPNTWINDEIVRLYAALCARGAAHSVECWRDGALVGGLYGVSLGAAFFGESMFSRETDASKVALVHLVARLCLGGYRLLDTQFLTPHLARFGGIEISRARYRRLLAEALCYRAVFPSGLPEAAGEDPLAVLQSSTLTS